jgi:UDP-2-acetamido-3-amino-2,3-dideoxy-glucuronate N-acetyltransferase
MTVPRDPSVFVHEKGLCESDDVGPRTRIWAFAHVMKGAVVGADCNVGDHAFIERGATVGDRVTVKNAVLVWEGVTVEDEVFLGPSMVFTNVRDLRSALRPRPEEFLPTRVRRGAAIGANATIVCGVTVGERALVGAGSVVVADVPAYALVVGNPARRVAWICICGQRLGEELACICGRRYRLIDERAGLAPAEP